MESLGKEMRTPSKCWVSFHLKVPVVSHSVAVVGPQYKRWDPRACTNPDFLDHKRPVHSHIEVTVSDYTVGQKVMCPRPWSSVVL